MVANSPRVAGDTGAERGGQVMEDCGVVPRNVSALPWV